MVVASSSIGLALHPSNLTASGSQSFAGTRGDSKGRSPWRAFGDFPRVGKVTRGGGAERPHKGRSAEDGAQPLLASGQQGPKAPAKGPASPRGRGDTLRSPRIGMLKKFL